MHEHTLSVLGSLFVGGTCLILWHMTSLTRHLIEYKTLQDARLYSEAIAEFRTLYTSEVVETVRSAGLEITHDYKGKPRAIPLPATLTLLLGERIGTHQSGARTNLYSAFPFPWRIDGGLGDRFAHDAWDYLREHPDGDFFRLEELDGRPMLRFATADRMRSSCVNCHNTHPSSPKHDWKEGDVRGVLEVSLPIHRVEAETRSGLRSTTLLMTAMTVAGLGLLALVFGRLRRTSFDLQEKVDRLQVQEREIRAINDDLVGARDAALAASTAKSQFLATMGHELRTPLNAIIGYSEMLKEDAEERGDASAVGDLGRIRLAGVGLRDIVASVLELSKLEAGGVTILAEPFDPAALARETAERHRGEAERKGNALSVHCPGDPGTLRSDRAMVQRCLDNLLSNACKFTERGRIDVEIGRENVDGRDRILFRVRDTGIGISPEQQLGLFQAFTQVDQSSTRAFGGIGLGLTIARRNARLLGGDIDVESAPGRGSTFTLRLPVEPPAPDR